MTTTIRITLTPAEIDILAAEAAGAGAKSVPAFVAGLLRARWAEMGREDRRCATCEVQADCSATVGDNDYCALWREARPPAQEQPREGVAVEEGEAGAVWLGNDDGGDGAAVYVCQILHLAQIVPAWREEGQEGCTVDAGGAYQSPQAPFLDGSQLRALSVYIADLYQCGECDQWYRGGTICPRCGKERE